MRKLILCMQVSLDGFIEGPNGDSSWIPRDDEESWADLFEMLKNVDLFVLGRVMYPEYREYWKQALTNPKASANEVAYAKLAEKTKHIVFSTTMKDPEWNNTDIFSGDVVDEVKRLKTLPGKDIQIVGGAKLAATLLNAGLVNEYVLGINPIIVGEGKSFFRDQHKQHNLKFDNVKTFKTGAMMARYVAK